MPIEGYVVAGLTVLAAIVGVVARVVAWRERWAPPIQFVISPLGTRVAITTRGAARVPDALIDAVRVLHRQRLDWFPGVAELDEYRVIVVPDGDVGKKLGEEQGGTEFVERCLPITPKVHVAVVQETDAAFFLAHEVVRHMYPRRLGLGNDGTHTLKIFEAPELEAKRAIKARMLERLGGQPK